MNKMRQLLLFVALQLLTFASSNGFGLVTSLFQYRQHQQQHHHHHQQRSFEAFARAGTTGSSSSTDGAKPINVDDVISSMGLTQVVKKGKKDTTTSMPTKSLSRITASINTRSNKKHKSKNVKKAGTTKTTNDINNNERINTAKVKASRKKKTNKITPKASPQSQLPFQDISLQTQLDYAREGHASIRNLIPSHIIEELYQDLKAYSTDKKYRKKGEDTAPFLQFYNTWRDLPSVQRLATSPLLCRAACTMLNLPIDENENENQSRNKNKSALKLRLYQDSVFIKRKNKDGITPWHIDGRMMPFDTSNVITFWIPLHSIPSIGDGGTGLLFINKSHADYSLPYWNGRGVDYDDASASSGGGGDGGGTDEYQYNAYEHLTTRYGIENVGDDRIVDNNPGVIGHHMPLNVGDCTVHNGWTMHCANGNKKNMSKKKNGSGGSCCANSTFQTRYAIAISYVDSHAEVRGDVPGVGKNVNVSVNGSGKGKMNRRGFSRAVAFLGDAEDRASYAEWIGDILPRTRFEHDLTPDVWPSSS